MSRTGIAVIGCGMAATPHALALDALKETVAVEGVYARNTERAQAFGEKFGFPVASDLDALLASPRVDIVLILTPPNAREDLVARAAANGKAVLCEKPLERTMDAAERIVGVCNKAGVPLGVVFQHRFREASEALSRLLAGGALGRIRFARVDVPWWRDQAYYDEPGRGTYARDGGGVLISQAIHTLDLMLSFTGPVAAVQGMLATTGFHTMEAEDFAAGALAFSCGAVGSLMATTACYPGEPEEIRLECEHASARLASGILTVNWRDGRKDVHGAEASTGGGADPMAFPFDWHMGLIADFVDVVRQGRPPRVGGADGLAVQRLIAALETSSREGRRVAL